MSADSEIQNETQINPRLSRLFFLGLIYFLLAIILTWPTATRLTTHLPGDGGDDPAIAWNLWWVKHALLNEGQNPFQTDYIFYPIGINLAFYTLTVLNAVTALPLTLNVGLVTVSNLHMLFTFAVGGYGTFLLTRYMLATIADKNPLLTHPGLAWTAAAVAGGFYAFASSKMFYAALGQFNIASNHWVPFAVLYLLRTRHQPADLKNPMLAGLFLAMQAWAEMTYASFLLIFVGLYWLFWILVEGRLSRNVQTGWQSISIQSKSVVAIGFVFVAGISPVLVQMVPDLRAEGDFLVEGGGFADVFSADLLGFIVPTMHHPILGELITQTDIRAFDKGQHIYLGFVLLGLLLVGFGAGYRYHPIRFWIIATAVFALLSLGPMITINGQVTEIRGPFTLLQSLPFFKGNRYPSRYSVMLMLCLSVIAGYALTQIGLWFGRWRQPASGIVPFRTYLPLFLIAGLFLLEHLSLPLPQSDMRVPAPYQRIASDPEDVTVLDIPVAWRNGFRITGPLTNQFMFGQFYQTVHHKQLLQGNTSRNPQFKFQYFTKAPIINSLLALEMGHPLPPERWEADQAIAADLLHFFNIRYVVVRPYRYERFDGTDTISVTEATIIPYIEQVLPVETIHDEETIKIYRVTDSMEQEVSLISDQNPGVSADLFIDTEHPLSTVYFGEGWGQLNPGRPIAAQRQRVRLLLPLGNGSQHVTLRMRLPDIAPAVSQAIALELNDWQSSWQEIGPTWQQYSFELPAEAVRPGLNEVWLHFSNSVRLRHWQPGTAPLDVTVRSAGNDVGDFGQIFVNGHDVSPNQRGYNVAIIQPDGAERTTVRVDSFDTHLTSSASAALAEFIATASPGSLVAVAAADEASLNLTEEAVLSLQSLGAAGDLRGCFRCSHAIIAQTTATGSDLAYEALDLLRPVGVTTNLGLTEPNLAAMVDWIRVETAAE